MYNNWYITYDREKKNTAGTKAPDDISSICRRLGYQEISIPRYPKNKSWMFRRIWILYIVQKLWNRYKNIIPENAIIVYQHPTTIGVSMLLINKLQNKKRAKFIAIIHDLESLRKGIEGVIENSKIKNKASDIGLLRRMDAIICHNEIMRQYMIGQGIPAHKLINLNIFDYLGDEVKRSLKKSESPTVAIAGNLAVGKCPYIYKIFDNGANPNLIVNLYGNGFQESEASKQLCYQGSFMPDELPGRIEGDFGLVWDGLSAETCTGNTGEYLRYNNPHKTSLYLSAGIPVIVWREAAIAKFVQENNVGIFIDTLYELEDAIRDVSNEQYKTMCNNVAALAKKLHEGYYFKNALETAIELIQEKRNII